MAKVVKVYLISDVINKDRNVVVYKDVNNIL